MSARTERLEDVLRDGEAVTNLLVLLRGGEDTAAKLLRQAALIEARYTYRGRPARGISLFGASGDLEARSVLGSKLRTFPKYRQIGAGSMAGLTVLLPTFQPPHWTALFQSPTTTRRTEADIVVDLLSILGPVLDNPEYEPTRSNRRR